MDAMVCDKAELARDCTCADVAEAKGCSWLAPPNDRPLIQLCPDACNDELCLPKPFIDYVLALDDPEIRWAGAVQEPYSASIESYVDMANITRTRWTSKGKWFPILPAIEPPDGQCNATVIPLEEPEEVKEARETETQQG